MPKPVTLRSGQVEFVKVNTERIDWRDAYQSLLGLTWPQFAAFVAAVYIVLNLIFAALYVLGGDSIAGIRSGSIPRLVLFQCSNPGYGWLRPLVSANALRPHYHDDRDHERCLSSCRHDRPNFRSVLAADRAHLVQQRRPSSGC